MNDDKVYVFFHRDGPIRLTERELCNDYMRLRDLSLSHVEALEAAVGVLFALPKSAQSKRRSAVLAQARAALAAKPLPTPAPPEMSPEFWHNAG